MALTTLAHTKLLLGITTSANDAQIQALIDSASARIENWCNRQFGAQDCIEWQDGGASIVARRAPLNNVNAVKIVDGSYFQVKYTGMDTLARVDVTAGKNSTAGTIRLTSSTAGATTIPLTGLISTVVNAINAVNGWEASFAGQELYGKAAWIPPLAGLDATTAGNAGGPASIPVAMGDLILTRYDVESGACQLTDSCVPLGGATFWTGTNQFYGIGNQMGVGIYANLPINYPRVFRGICLDYNGGMDPIPDDVQQTCVDMVQYMLQNAANSSMLLGGEALGGYSYTNAGGSNGRIAGGAAGTLAGLDALMKERLSGWTRMALPC